MSLLLLLPGLAHAARSVAETAALVDVLTARWDAHRAFEESVGVSDVASRAGYTSRVVEDVASAMDELSRIGYFSRDGVLMDGEAWDEVWYELLALRSDRSVKMRPIQQKLQMR